MKWTLSCSLMWGFTNYKNIYALEDTKYGVLD